MIGEKDEYGNTYISEGQAICRNCRFYKNLWCDDYGYEVEPCDNFCSMAEALNSVLVVPEDGV